MKRLITAALVLAMATSCASTFTASAASVNGREISRSVVDQAVESQLSANPTADDPETRSQLARDVLSSLIQQELLSDLAARRGLTADAAEIEKQIDEIRASFATEEEFQQQLDAAGLTMEQLRERLAIRLLQTELAKELVPRPTDQDLRNAYDEQDLRFREIQVKHILFAADETNASEIRTRTERAMASLRARSATFREIAKGSDDPSSAQAGGVLADTDGNRPGWIPVSSLDQAFGTAAFRARPGSLVGPVRSTFGFHIIVLIAKRTTPFEAVKDQIADEIQAQAGQESVQQAVSEAGAVANVLVNPRYGDWEPATQSVVPHESYVPAGKPEASPSPSPSPGAGAGLDSGG